MTDVTATITDNAEQHRFEVTFDGTVAAFSDYHDRGRRRSFLHTEVDPAYEGQGLGSRLVRHVLDDARTRGLDVLPHCEFVRNYIADHREDYLGLVPEDERAQFGLVTRPPS